MKKLIMAMAVVATAAAVHASTFSWGLGSGSFDATKFKDATAYLFYSTGTTLSLPDTTGWDTKTSFSYADIKSANATELEGARADIQNGLFDGATSAANYGSLVPADVGLTSQKMVKFYMALISDDGKNVAIVTSVKQAMISTASTPASAKWTTSDVSVYTAVPEPTSGLLLLLGVAGLALRRRRA